MFRVQQNCIFGEICILCVIFKRISVSVIYFVVIDCRVIGVMPSLLKPFMLSLVFYTISLSGDECSVSLCMVTLPIIPSHSMNTFPSVQFLSL